MSPPYMRVLRIAAWFCVALLAVLSLIPGNIQVRSGMPGGYEHAIAYLGTATMLMLSYPGRGREIAGGLVAYSGLLEILQYLVPGRTPNIFDAFASGAGAVLGVIIWTTLIEQRSRQATASSGSSLMPEEKCDLDLR